MNKIHIASAFIKGKQETSAKIAIILGSGLGEFAETLEDRTTISYQDIPWGEGATCKPCPQCTP